MTGEISVVNLGLVYNPVVLIVQQCEQEKRGLFKTKIVMK